MAYGPNSPYYATGVVSNQFLDVMVNRPLPKNVDDIYWEITSTYHLRPDMLAYDLYTDPGLWWVFSQRNPNRLQDPMFDFVTGVGIYLPTRTTLSETYGI